MLRDVLIDSVGAEGRAVARRRLSETAERDTVIFIPYGAPGDVADVQLTRKKNSYAEGRIVDIKVPGKARITPVCTHYGTCGGCRWQHLDYSEQLRWKRQQVQDALERIGKVAHPEVSPTLGSSNIYEYRNKMEYTFSHKKWRTLDEVKSGREFTDSSNALGFHIPGAFDKVLHIEHCHLQTSLGDDIRNAIFDYAEANGYTFYNIRDKEGDLRSLMIRTASTGEVMVVVVFGSEDIAKIQKMMDMLKERFPEITSLLYAVNMKANDTLSGVHIFEWHGRDYIEEEMEELRFRVNAKSFYQTNSLQAYELYKIARRFAGLEQAPEQKPVVYDLYTGTGTIANFVARNSRKVIGIEYVEEAVADARLNSKVNGIDNTIFYAGDMKDVLTDEFVEKHGRPDIMIIDPPRAGMHPDVVKVVRNASPGVIVYVSCNPATQARDLNMLDDLYEITDVQPVDMFPHTHHVENVVRLQLRPQPKIVNSDE